MQEQNQSHVKIYMVRHGQTDLNKRKIFRGRYEAPLNSTGIEEARCAAGYLKGRKISFILTSPLKRCFETASIIGGRFGIHPEALEYLMDIDFGRWQGMNQEDVVRKYRRIYKQWIEEPHRIKFPAGEGLCDVRRRVQKLMNYIKSNHAGQEGVVVTHRVTAKVIVCVVARIPLGNFWNIKVDTASISTFEIIGKRFVLDNLNITTHLEKLKDKRVTYDF